MAIPIGVFSLVKYTIKFILCVAVTSESAKAKKKSSKRKEREQKNREGGGEGKRVHATAKQIH